MMKEKQKVTITFHAYDALVEAAERVYRNSRDPEYRKKRGIFRFADRFPTVEQLKDNRVEENLDEFLPYLTYWYEVFQSDNPEFVRTKQYIHNVLMTRLELK